VTNDNAAHVIDQILRMFAAKQGFKWNITWMHDHDALAITLHYPGTLAHTFTINGIDLERNHRRVMEILDEELALQPREFASEWCWRY
jgi:hypothetical protein